MPGSKLKILIAEHDQSDVDLIVYELNKSGISFVSQTADSEITYTKALTDFKPDIILSDYTFPSFDGLRTFVLRQELAPEIPFIFVSGTIGEERAVQLIKDGVSDYALKDSLFTLPPKIIRAFEEAQTRKEKTATADQLIVANHLYAFISQLNQNIVRVKDEATLYHNACQMAIEFGKYRMAWIGLINTENETISLIEQCGISIDDTPLFISASYAQNGPQRQVLMTGKYYICHDIQKELQLPQWFDFANERGLRSFMILPIRKGGNIIGTFNLYSSEVNFSDIEEIKLLVEATGDISFALDLFERDKKHLEAEDRIVKNEQRFRALVENSSDAMMILSAQGGVEYASPSFERILGFNKGEFPKENMASLAHQDDLPVHIKMWEEAMITSGVPTSSYSTRVIKKNGTARWIISTMTNMLHDPAVNGVVVNFRDATEEVLLKEQLEFDKNNLDALINNVSDLMWSVDRNFNLITSNKPFNDMVQRNFNHIVQQGECILDVSSTPEMYNHFRKTYERVFAGESLTETNHYEFPTEAWTDVSFSPIRKGSEIVGAACNSRDITTSKLSERQLRKSEAFNSGVLNSLHSHIAVIDQSGFIVAVNESWKIFAKENGQPSLVSTNEGANYFEVCKRAAQTGATDAAAALEGIQNVMTGRLSNFSMEYTCHSPTENRWFDLSVIKFGGTKPMVVVSHQNITQRKQAEQDLQQSESRLKQAQALSHIGNWEYDLQTNVHVWSDELFTIFGIQGQNKVPSMELFMTFVHPEDVDKIKGIVAEGFVTLRATSYNFRFIRSDGELRHGHTERKFEFDQNGKAVRLLGVLHDITERKLIEEEREQMITSLVQHTKNLEQFTSIVSHNLRAPVANILGLSNVLKNNISQDDRKQSEQYLFAATAQLDEMLKDLNFILQAKSEINEYKETIYFEELVATIESSIHLMMKQMKAQIIIDFSSQEYILSLRSYLHSIFYNLISNSIKYKRLGVPPVITIKTELTGDKIRISFMDNGLGIDLTKHGHNIFGLYKRFHEHTEGKGLGLFMVKTQVETLGGTIRVESTLNHGTEFIIELPV